MTGLQPDSCYYLKVAAVNENGDEGYHVKEPLFVKTMEPLVNNCDGLYVWGYNARNELGLPDNTIDDVRDEYVSGAMSRPIRNPMFDGFVYQVAPGNVSTLFLCVNPKTKDTLLVACGVCFAPNEGFEDSDVNELTEGDVAVMVQDVPSIPFEVPFNIPVVQIMCGDLFQGLLTAHGQVYTWGSNMFGQLGHSAQSVALVMQPKLVQFKDTSSTEKRSIFIRNISCGYNHCVALSDQDQVFVWGKRMGIYPNVELTF